MYNLLMIIECLLFAAIILISFILVLTSPRKKKKESGEPYIQRWRIWIEKHKGMIVTAVICGLCFVNILIVILFENPKLI